MEGWINIDSVAALQPDLVHDISQPLPYDDLTVDEILAEDLLEHFDKYLRFVVFYEWVRVLKIGGTMTLQVPDFKKILRKYFKFGYDNFVDFILVKICGSQRPILVISETINGDIQRKHYRNLLNYSALNRFALKQRG